MDARSPRAVAARCLWCLFAATLLLAASGCRVTSLPLWSRPVPPADALEVEAVRGLAYYHGPDADDVRHRLDLFVPRGAHDCPVVVLVHGGAWAVGDNCCCGLYSSVGELLASRGVAVVLPNYRLSPAVRHPEHARDVARAVAWARSHIAAYGGADDRIFLAGHSAGGHLVALLATDETYLEAEGLRAADLKGVIAISGVYHLPPAGLAFTVGGNTSRAFRLDEVFPVRGGRPRARPEGWPGVPITLDVFRLTFGDDPRDRQRASPLNHVRPGLPPFLIVSAERDLPTLADMAEEFHQALRNQGCESAHLRAEGRNHNSVLFRAVETGDPVARAVLDFIGRHAGDDRD